MLHSQSPVLRLLLIEAVLMTGADLTCRGQEPVPVRVGTAQRDITPPMGLRLCGAFHERLSTGVHDPLWVRAVVFSQGEVTFAVAGCDLAMISPAVASQARTSIAGSCGILPDHVLIHASETHNGPDYFGEFRDAFHRRALAEHGRDPAETEDFPQRLAEAIAAAVCEARGNLRPTTLAAGSGQCQGLSFNRRFRMRNGSIGWNPGKMNPAIVAPAGPIDSEVPVMTFCREGETEPFGILTGFAMHLAILNDTAYSADYPFYLTKYLQEGTSPELFVHFMQAPCCEVNHIDVSHKRPQKGYAWAEHVGQTLAEVVLATLPALETLRTPSLAARAKRILLSLRQYPPDAVARERERWYGSARGQTDFLVRAHAATVTGIYDRHEGGPVPVLLQGFRFDANTALIGLPSEVSVELGLMIKEQSPFPRTLVVQLSNDWLGYIPPKRIFAEGNYEVVVAKIQPGQGEVLAQEAIAVLQALKQQ